MRKVITLTLAASVCDCVHSRRQPAGRSSKKSRSAVMAAGII